MPIDIIHSFNSINSRDQYLFRDNEEEILGSLDANHKD